MEPDNCDRHDILLTRRQVEARCCLSTSSIYRFMRDGLFPEPIRVGRRAVRWHATEIEEWLASRPRATGDLSSA
ncbi:AlpA family phage regulatory protein [Candidatus Poribacteria bacterium]|nr:AlpA family phage regulatory protein [bacterium]MYH71450.1 AlpA family phage regulatory protein [Acidimicrobiia bacterium]MYK97146.1 AlpA family phage regulatory protein [Candidatus Poribacteria bacterium]